MMHSSWDMKRDGQNFFVIFDCFLPFCPLTTQKIKVLKKRKKVWRYYHFTHLYHKCQSYDVWFMRYEAGRTEFYVIFDCLLQFYPPNNPKNQILKNWKKHLEKKTNNFTRVPKMTIKWCVVPEILTATGFFCHFGPFFALFPPKNPKNQNF